MGACRPGGVGWGVVGKGCWVAAFSPKRNYNYSATMDQPFRQLKHSKNLFMVRCPEWQEGLKTIFLAYSVPITLQRNWLVKCSVWIFQSEQPRPTLVNPKQNMTLLLHEAELLASYFSLPKTKS